MVGTEPLYAPRQECLRRVGTRADVHLAGLQSARECHLAFKVGDLVRHECRLPEEHVAEIRRLHTVAVPREQRQAHARLELLDASAQRRLGDSDRGGGATDAAVLRQRLGVPDRANVELHLRVAFSDGIARTYGET
jgi:hypothetical protein